MEERSFSGAIRTDRIVGREAELAAIGAAIPAPEDRTFHCVIILAEGGKGKTRLLQAVEAEMERLDRPKDSLICLPMIDVADPSVHSITAFLETVYQHLKRILTPGQIEPFALFAEHLQSYRRDRDKGAAYNRVKQRRDEVISAFLQAYSELTRRTRVVVVLDTLEQIFSLSPEIEELLKYELGIASTEIGPNTFAWLYNFILRRPENTTVLLAGRPDPSRWATTVEDALKQVARIANEPMAVPLRTIRLHDFTYDESVAYITQLRNELSTRPHLAQVADYLQDVLEDETQLQVLHRLTKGNPIRLALYIDLLVNGGEYPEPFRTSPRLLATMSLVEREALQTDIDRALLTYIARGLSDVVHEVLDYLSVMRRGLDAARLAHLRGGTLEEAAAILKRLTDLSFVKVRSDETGSARYYLHDELYTIYQRQFDAGEAEQATVNALRRQQQEIFKRLIAFCDQERGRVSGELFTLLSQPLPQEPGDRAMVTASLGRLRQQRRALYVETLHYHLYLEPRDAFNTLYLELAEQAFTANDIDLNDQLQSEIEIFFFGGRERARLNRLQTGLAEMRWDRLRFVVLHERVTNATRRLITANRNGEAMLLVENALDHHERLIQNSYQDYPHILAYYTNETGKLLNWYFQLEWKAYGQLAKIYAGGKDTRPAIDAMVAIGKEIEQRLTEIPREVLSEVPGAEAPPPDGNHPLHPSYRDRVQNLVAQIYNGAAYGYSTLSAFLDARVAYQRADFILLVTPPADQVLHAILKNNLSRVMAELGATNIALSLCDDGIAHNKRLGLDYRVAMGYNTKALIYNRGHLHEQAFHLADKALQIFRQLDEPRGIGLTLIQRGEAYLGRARAIYDELSGSPAGDRAAVLRLFELADIDLAEADQIFSDGYHETVRQIEANMARGCLFGAWAAALEDEARSEYVKLAVAAYDRVIALTREYEYRHYRISALLDKAALYVEQGHVAAAETTAQGALAFIPADHRLDGPTPFDPAYPSPDAVVFRELSQYEGLHADITSRKVDEAAQTHNVARETLAIVAAGGGTPAQRETTAAAERAAADDWRASLRDSLRHRLLAMAYLQLFSPSESWYLGRHADQLYLLLDQARKHDWHIQRVIKPMVDQLVREYALDRLEPYLGPPGFQWIVTGSFALPGDLEYLNPEKTS